MPKYQILVNLRLRHGRSLKPVRYTSSSCRFISNNASSRALCGRPGRLCDRSASRRESCRTSQTDLMISWISERVSEGTSGGRAWKKNAYLSTEKKLDTLGIICDARTFGHQVLSPFARRIRQLLFPQLRPFQLSSFSRLWMKHFLFFGLFSLLVCGFSSDFCYRRCHNLMRWRGGKPKSFAQPQTVTDR
jgi:hypothetical protein